jgi:hypothetical protein
LWAFALTQHSARPIHGLPRGHKAALATVWRFVLARLACLSEATRELRAALHAGQEPRKVCLACLSSENAAGAKALVGDFDGTLAPCSLGLRIGLAVEGVSAPGTTKRAGILARHAVARELERERHVAVKAHRLSGQHTHSANRSLPRRRHCAVPLGHSSSSPCCCESWTRTCSRSSWCSALMSLWSLSILAVQPTRTTPPCSHSSLNLSSTTPL